MKFGYTIIYVKDVKTTLDFYAAAFNLKTVFLHESEQYGELDTGATKLAFVSEALAQSNGADFVPNTADANKAPGFEIALVTDNVALAYQQALNAQAIAIKAPMEKPWGQLVAYVRDLNGILVEICSPMG